MDGVSFESLMRYLVDPKTSGLWGNEISAVKASGPSYRYYFKQMCEELPTIPPQDPEMLSITGKWVPCHKHPVRWGGCIRRWRVYLETPLPSLEES